MLLDKIDNNVTFAVVFSMTVFLLFISYPLPLSIRQKTLAILYARLKSVLNPALNSRRAEQIWLILMRKER